MLRHKGPLTRNCRLSSSEPSPWAQHGWAAGQGGPCPGGGESALLSPTPAPPADHPQLHAPLPAPVPRGLRGPAQGQRALRPGELQVLRLHRDPVHSRDRLSEPPGGLRRSSWGAGQRTSQGQRRRPKAFGPPHARSPPPALLSLPGTRRAPALLFPCLRTHWRCGSGSQGLLIRGSQQDRVTESGTPRPFPGSGLVPHFTFSSADHPAEDCEQPFCQRL